MRKTEARAVVLSLLAVLSVVGGTVAFSGTAAAATNVSISPDDDTAGAADVTYTAEGNVELGNQDTLQYVDVDLGTADVSNVGASDVAIYIDGTEYTDGFSQFSTSNGVVEFKLANSRSLSDGDPIRVVVGDVTNPSDDFTAVTTLHDTGDAQWQSLSDGVDIQTAASITYSDFSVDRTTVSPGNEVTVTATVENTGEQSGTYSAPLKVDGVVQRYRNGTLDGGESTTVSFETAFSSTGSYDVAIDTLGPTTVDVVDPTEITGGSADPAQVQPGTTVSNQQVMIDVANVSQDGNTDTHYVEFPNDLASELSVNSVDSSATSITSSPNVVDGYDDDGVADTVTFATSGDGGGVVDTTLTVDVSVAYPATHDVYFVDVRTVDSTGDVVTETQAARLEAFYENDDDSDGSIPYSGSEELSVTDVDLTANSEDVDVAVSTTRAVDTLRVSVDGAADEELVRDDFTVRERDDKITYVADVASGTTGSFSASVEAAAADGRSISPEASDTLTLGAAAAADVNAAAAPPWVEAQSVHTVTATVPDGTANETLRAVDVGYSEAFLDESGSVSSVSDDQNVAMLTVVAADGSVKSEMGDTDAVSVNVDDGTVELDLSDVDSSRTPTLAPGDRVIVRLRPVTNPEVADTYETTVTLETAGGQHVESTSAIDIRSEANTDAFASAVVQPSDERVSVDLPSAAAVSSVTVASDGDAAGTVRVAIPDERPDAAADLDGPVVTTMNISRPDPVENDSATVTVSVSRSAFEANAGALAIARYDDESGEWVPLDTTVESSDDSTVTLQATTAETSLFAVTSDGTTADQDGSDGGMTDSDSDSGSSDQEADTGTDSNSADQQSTTQPTDTARSTPTDAEETSSSGPGFGALGAALAVLGAALLLRRRG